MLTQSLAWGLLSIPQGTQRTVIGKRSAQGCYKIGAAGTVGQESAVGSGQRPQRRRNRDGWPAGQLDRGPLGNRLAEGRRLGPWNSPGRQRLD